MPHYVVHFDKVLILESSLYKGLKYDLMHYVISASGPNDLFLFIDGQL